MSLCNGGTYCFGQNPHHEQNTQKAQNVSTKTYYREFDDVDVYICTLFVWNACVIAATVCSSAANPMF